MILLLAALALQADEPVEDRYFIVREHVETFEVPGYTYRQFYRNVDDHGPRGKFSGFRYELGFEGATLQRGDQCRPEGETVLLDLTFTLPAWSNYERARDRDKEAFDEVYADQRAFLEGYAEVTRRGGYRLLQDLREVGDLPCSELQGVVDEIWGAWTDAIEEAVDIYGERAGTVPLVDTVCRETGTRARRCRN
jgi:predicted secreted Zn-dependent protease